MSAEVTTCFSGILALLSASRGCLGCGGSEKLRPNCNYKDSGGAMAAMSRVRTPLEHCPEGQICNCETYPLVNAIY